MVETANILGQVSESETAGIGRNSLAILGGSLVTQAINFLVVVYLARILGPEGYGQLSLATAILLFGIPLADLGLQTLGIRAVAQDMRHVSAIMSNYVSLKFCLAIVTFLCMTAFALLSGRSTTVQILTIMYGGSLLAASLLIDWVFIGLGQMGIVGLARVLQWVIYACSLYVLLRKPGDILVVPLVYTLGLVSSLIFLAFIFRRRYPNSQFAPNPKLWGKLVRQALPLGAYYLIIQLYISLPPLLLGWIKDEAAVGLYGAAFRLMQVPHQLLGLFFVTLYPATAHRWKYAPESLADFLEKVLRLVLIICTPVAAGTMVIAPELVVSVLGERFSASALPLQLIIWNLFIGGVNAVYAQLVLLMQGKQKELLVSVSAEALVSVLLNLTLIPSLSYVGAAIAWVLSENVACLIAYWLSRPFVRLRLWSLSLRPLLASSLMGLECWALLRQHVSVWLIIPAGMLGYGLFLLGLGGFRGEEWSFIKGVLVRHASRK